MPCTLSNNEGLDYFNASAVAPHDIQKNFLENTLNVFFFIIVHFLALIVVRTAQMKILIYSLKLS